MSKKSYTPRERAIYNYGRQVERKVQEGLRRQHRVVVRACGQKVVDATVAELYEQEKKRDGVGGALRDCTMIELPLKTALNV